MTNTFNFDAIRNRFYDLNGHPDIAKADLAFSPGTYAYLYEEGFVYTTSADEKLPAFYEQAKGWIEETCNALLDTNTYRVVCALASMGKNLYNDFEELPFY